MVTEHQILVRAREIIADPARWTQGAFARDASGEATDPCSDNAVCFCALGATYRATMELGADWRSKVLASDMLYAACGQNPVIPINDNDGHAAILAIFDKAIKASEMEAA